MKLVDFQEFIDKNGLQDQDDETITSELIKEMSTEKFPRLALKNFPQNVTQAKYFVKNGVVPSGVFYLKCSKDICQERMSHLDTSDPKYLNSASLSHIMKEFNEKHTELLPYLRENTKFAEISTDIEFAKTMKSIQEKIQPFVIHVRPGVKQDELRQEIVKSLSNDHGFVNLDISQCIRGESERGTDLGQEFYKLLLDAKVIPADMIV